MSKNENLEIGSGHTPDRVYRSYSFDALKKRGDFFVITDLSASLSLRSGATKQGAKRGIVFRVQKTKQVGAEPLRKHPVLVVTHCGKVKK